MVSFQQPNFTEHMKTEHMKTEHMKTTDLIKQSLSNPNPKKFLEKNGFDTRNIPRDAEIQVNGGPEFDTTNGKVIVWEFKFSYTQKLPNGKVVPVLLATLNIATDHDNKDLNLKPGNKVTAQLSSQGKLRNVTFTLIQNPTIPRTPRPKGSIPTGARVAMEGLRFPDGPANHPSNDESA